MPLLAQYEIVYRAGKLSTSNQVNNIDRKPKRQLADKDDGKALAPNDSNGIVEQALQ
jgi:hypothetical protein